MANWADETGGLFAKVDIKKDVDDSLPNLENAKVEIEKDVDSDDDSLPDLEDNKEKGDVVGIFRVDDSGKNISFNNIWMNSLVDVPKRAIATDLAGYWICVYTENDDDGLVRGLDEALYNRCSCIVKANTQDDVLRKLLGNEDFVAIYLAEIRNKTSAKNFIECVRQDAKLAEVHLKNMKEWAKDASFSMKRLSDMCIY